jgi:hypothetical protein
MLELILIFFLIVSFFEINFLQKKKIKNFVIKFSIFFLIVLVLYDFYILTKILFFYKSIFVVLKKFNIFLYNYFLFFCIKKKYIYLNSFSKVFSLKKQQQLNLNKIKIYAKQ